MGGPLDGSWDVEFGLRYFLTSWLGINGGYSYAGTKIVIHDPEGFLWAQTSNIFFGATLVFDQRLIKANVLGSKDHVL